MVEKKQDNKKNPQKHIIELLAENEKPISNLIDKLNNSIENISKQFLNHKSSESKFSLKMAYLLTGLISLIVIIAAVLTLYGKLDGSALTFLFGLLIGYMLTFIREAIYPNE